MTRNWYDCEFLENGRTIIPISIAIVADDGREYYAVFADMPVDDIRQHPWLMENVVPYLPADRAKARMLRTEDWYLDREHPDVKDTATIAAEVRQFLTGHRDRHPVELWGYYSSYDHIMLCQLWGRMIDHPVGIPMLTLDIQQEALRLGLDGTLPKQDGDLHNALADARWTRDAWAYLREAEAARGQAAHA